MTPANTLCPWSAVFSFLLSWFSLKFCVDVPWWTPTKCVKIAVLCPFFIELWVILCIFGQLTSSIKPPTRKHAFLY